MYPKPQEKEALKDVMVFILVLGFIALIGFIYTVIEMVSRGESLKHIIIRSLDIITIVVPPALPAAMSVGIINANSRLKKKKIFCTSPTTVNVCGLINVVSCSDIDNYSNYLFFLRLASIKQEHLLRMDWTSIV